MIISTRMTAKGFDLPVGEGCRECGRKGCSSTDEVRFACFPFAKQGNGVRARPVGGAGAYAPEEVHFPTIILRLYGFVIPGLRVNGAFDGPHFRLLFRSFSSFPVELPSSPSPRKKALFREPFCLPSFIPFFYPAYASSWRRSMRPLMVLRL